ncbi:MAG: methyltransferase domain-containing protein, partial [Pseudomonadota bacterium]
RLQANGITRSHVTIPLAEFQAYLDEVDYPKTYPTYFERFSATYVKNQKDASLVNRKFFEQFLSMRLTQPGPEHVTADLAAANGPFSNIIKKRCGVRISYHQDLNAANARLHPYLGNDAIETIACNATELPFEDGSVDYMYLLNSWEHFQAPTDLDVLREVERCLSDGGKLVIVPLNGAKRAFVKTDPDLWDSKQVYEKGELPLFRTSVPVHVAKCGQVYAQHHDADLLVEFAAATPALRYEVVTIELDEPAHWMKEGSWDVLIAQKTSS